MSKFKLGKRSNDNLLGVHPDLVKIVRKAIEITEIDFGVTEGLRSPERQKQLLKEGSSTTTRSRHLTGHAVDLAAYVDGKVSWDWSYYEMIAAAMKAAADAVKLPVEWGGDWKSFKDGPHFQLPWSTYK